ncbi:hypothetical protein TOT_020000850 [Theileria orientalis strain Shintoku]|uniref:Uncharacterized protein n=1 Tax=Theileria orientalis strain Shintoku TaxID=869250 RepID=J4D863_THEOR|nr:hypothetical protein TOT_020000850 [Theileria orientalis strain Shintoku]BAM40595.1 hypothetical protein TOT_020000850 [Theileria orientalis strain Shintoku]|eukprot:XP_009690896.1 hypothetical protein TOT_020000850 [Theileria orientalis strain Shintoku]
MAAINFEFKKGVYIIGRQEISVMDKDCGELGNYHMYIHAFKKPHPMGELEIRNKSETVLLYLTEDYETNHILFLAFYVSNNNPERPLTVQIWRSDHSARMYSYSEMLEKSYSEISKLRELSRDLAKELKDELYKIGGRITFMVDKGEDYKDVKVKKEPAEDKSFVKITHSPQCEFKSSTLRCSSQCDLLNYMTSDYNSKTLKGIVVYFHLSDVKLRVPLLVSIQATKRENTPYMEHWAYDGMDGLKKMYSIMGSREDPIVDVRAVYYSHENQCSRQVSFKGDSRIYIVETRKNKGSLAGVVLMVLVSFITIGGIVAVSAYKYYKRYGGYHGSR